MNDVPIEYDFIISIGRFCHCTALLANNGLKIIDGPWDWSGTVYEDVMYERIKALRKGFCNHFNKRDFVNFEYIEEEFRRYFNEDAIRPGGATTPYCKPKGYYNKRTKTYFTHDFREGIPFDEEFRNVREKYMRRYTRTLNMIKRSRRTLLVYMSHIAEQGRDLPLNTKKVLREMSKLRKAYPNSIIDLYMFDHNPSFSGTNFRREVIDAGIVRYHSNHDDVFPSNDTNTKHIADGLMMPQSICYILSKLALSNHCRAV